MDMVSPASKRNLSAGLRPAFPPSIVVAVKALACELPHRCGLPLSRWSLAHLQREVVAEGIVAQVSGSTCGAGSAARRCAWRYRSWIFPHDPNFAAKAGRVLDLYQGCWRGAPLGRRDFVLSADEKTSIQARIRIHPSLPAAPGRCTRIEQEYQRAGACAYIAAWDVHRARLFGRCENTTGIQPFDRLVEQVMSVQPYRSARRVFWITDNGSSHRGEKAANRLRAAWPSIVLVHNPVHASRLNQIESYFSIVQRKVLAPNDFSSLAELQQRLLALQDHYHQAAVPFSGPSPAPTSTNFSPALTLIPFAPPLDPPWSGGRLTNCAHSDQAPKSGPWEPSKRLSATPTKIRGGLLNPDQVLSSSLKSDARGNNSLTNPIFLTLLGLPSGLPTIGAYGFAKVGGAYGCCGPLSVPVKKIGKVGRVFLRQRSISKADPAHRGPGTGGPDSSRGCGRHVGPESRMGTLPWGHLVPSTLAARSRL